MNVNDYKDKKAKGLAEIVKAGGGYALAVKRFSEDDGNELTSEIEAIDINDLIARKADLEIEVEDYADLIADITKMKV